MAAASRRLFLLDRRKGCCAMATLASRGILVPKQIKEEKLARLVSVYSRKRVLMMKKTECGAEAGSSSSRNGEVAFAAAFHNMSELMLFFLNNGMSRRGLPEAFRLIPELSTIVYDPKKFAKVLEVLRGIGDQAAVHKIVRIVPAIFTRDPNRLKKTINDLENLGVEKSLLTKRPVYLSLDDLDVKTKFLHTHGVSKKAFGKVLKIWKGAADLSFDELKHKVHYLASFGVLGKNLERFIVKYPWFLRSENLTVEECCPLFKKNGLEGRKFAQMVAWYPGALKSADSLSTRGKVLVSAGLEKDSLIYKSALAVAALTRADGLENRISRYVSYGFSTAEVQEMFRKQPRILRISDKFLKLKMRFLLQSVKLPRDKLIKSPNYLLYSLDSRLRPRFHVAGLALLNGVVSHELSWKGVFYATDKQFLMMVASWNPEALRISGLLAKEMDVEKT